MNIFLTGSEGFIGSHLTENLVKAGHNVKCLIQYNFKNSHGWLENIENKIKKEVEIFSGDIRDKELMYKVLKKNTDVIFNLAALIGIPYSYEAPQSYFETNTIGTLNLLNVSKKLNNLSCFIQTSTSEVYGTARSVPISEEHPLSAQSPYAASKIAADQLAISFYKSYKLPVAIIRPFNTYGPRQSGRAIIPTIITQILKKNKIIKLGNLNPSRDFTYVDDTVRAFVKTINNKRIIGETINIGNNFEISIKDIVEILKKDFGYNFKIIRDKNRVRAKDSEVFRLIASNKKAKKILKWKPQYQGLSGFKKGLNKTIEWFKKSQNLKEYKTKIYSI